MTKKQTEVCEDKRYGMIFHMPSNIMSMRWLSCANMFSNVSNTIVEINDNGEAKYELLSHPKYSDTIENLIYPIGFQPFMRCHMQNGYAVYMRREYPLQYDIGFKKLRFLHNEKLSAEIYEKMHGGELIYPHEGLEKAEFIINQISRLTEFSEEAFMYALCRNHQYCVSDERQCREDIERFSLDGKFIKIVKDRPWKISSGRRYSIDALYKNFSIESHYGIQVMERKVIPPGADMFAPWMMLEKDNSPGADDFKARPMEGCVNLWTRQAISLLQMVEYAQPQDFI